MGETPLHRLRALQEEIRSNYGYFGLPTLQQAVQRALAEPPPRGSLDDIDHQQARLSAFARTADRQRNRFTGDVRDRLAAAWIGTAHVRAGPVVSAIDEAIARLVELCERGGQALSGLGSAIAAGQALHGAGVSDLERAAALLRQIEPTADYDSGEMERAHHLAMAGIATMVRAAATVKAASDEAVDAIDAAAATAHLGRLTSTSITPIDKLLAAEAVGPADPAHGANLILTADTAARASARLDRLSAEDAETFRIMLALGSTPEARAYLLKALAAGYPMAELTTLGAAVRQHGDDPAWLEAHLFRTDN